MSKLLIFSPREEPAELIADLEAAGCEIIVGDRAWSLPRGDHEPALIEAARDCVALMGTSLRHTPISRRVLEAAQRLRIVAKYTVGVDDVDVEAATELGILVCHAPTEANCFGVAETAVAMTLALLKQIRERDAAVRAGAWREPHLATTYLGARIDGHPGVTIGFVGFGRIATRVSQLLAPWRVRMIAYDPYAEPARFLLANVRRVDYDTLLRESDVISFHVVLTAETRGMFSAREIELTKPSAVVVNTSRGKVIDEDALASALQRKRLRAAAIDTFAEEPLPADSPLRQLGHEVLFSPHSASFNEGGELRPGLAWAARAVKTALAGEVPDNVYNRDVIARWKERFGGARLGA
jgi:D-3-phosphoglycerate dehydrogenase / 2-oxoglutarate reductase